MAQSGEWILGLAVAAALAAGCVAATNPTATPSPTDLPTPVITPAASLPQTAEPTPLPLPTPPWSPEPSLRPAIEVAGRMTIAIESPRTTLEGVAACDIPEGVGPAVVGTIRAQDLGRAGGHRVHAWVTLVLEGAPAGAVDVSLGQGMEDLPPGSAMPEYAGLAGPVGVSTSADGSRGTISFTSLSKGERGFIGGGWPEAISGRISWECDPIPAGPTPAPPGAVGTATLSGAVVATFPEAGEDCPTASEPIGFMTGTTQLDGRAAILELSFSGDDGLSFVLYRTPGDKEDMVRGHGAVPVRANPDGRGWTARLESTTEVGPVTLEVRWACGG